MIRQRRFPRNRILNMLGALRARLQRFVFNRRSARRAIQLLWLAEVACDKGSGPAIIINISRTGLMFQSEIVSGLQAGDQVSLTVRDVGILSGEVRWIRISRCGVRLKTPIDVTALLKKRTENKRLNNNTL